MAAAPAPPVDRATRPAPAASHAPAPVATNPDPGGPRSSAGIRRDIGFKSARHLADHFEKHGSEFGAITREEYLLLAQELRDRPAIGPIREIVRQDGVITRFDRDSGAFIAFEKQGTLRTCFRPNDGEAYFERQARRRSSR